ncbi:Ribosome biogenesis ATPase RIX7 [Pleurostoma richardsiae]|uniref:Peroxisomal ATPase PEX1 n=1 Tax=Pleurostoma richardsiae TaxID=41990 RepID=A0AA38RB22_9PEZI|nr:Ribosome biogenesis ATPase RIX7 [Pleurostoma richardsiae]
MIGRARPSLRQGLDRDIYQIVRKLEDERECDGSNRRITVTSVYDYIKGSNSSLARQKKRPLEDAIERVLTFRKDELKEEEGDDSDAAIEAAEKRQESHNVASKSRERDGFILNKQLTKHWSFSATNTVAAGGASAPSSGRQTPAATPGGSVAMDVDGPAPPAAERQPNGEPKSKRRRREKEGPDRSAPTGVSTDDMAGIDGVLEKLRKPVCLPLWRGEAFAKLGYRFADGVLLHGPSGCGKTTLANALAGSLEVAYIPISAPSLVGGTSGESEKNIRDLFDEAIRLAPCLMFIDEIDSIAGKKENAQKGMEGRMVSEISLGMDRVALNTENGKNVVVLAATNRPDAIEPAIRRRFGVEIDMGMPDQRAREEILRTLTRDLTLSHDVDFEALGRLTPGYVGADLKNVVTTAVFNCLGADMDQQIDLARQAQPDAFAELSAGRQKWRLFQSRRAEPVGDIRITFAHFRAAVAEVQPAAKREGFSTVPDTTWAHVGAMHDVRRKLEMTIIGPITQPERFAKVGIKAAAGILLWGPPGCGKTLVAKAVANESKANFISIKGPELLNKYVGESERAVRQLFARAKSSAPCILFFDEMDALVPRRDDSLSDASARVVNTLLTELDGVGDRSGIYVIGATNRPDIIDPAIRRPGRLGTSIFVGLPSPDDRVEILKTLYRNTIRAPGAANGASDVAIAASLERIARDMRCAGFSGADLGNLMQAAAHACLERTFFLAPSASVTDPEITLEDWEKALREVKPSVKDDGKYETMLAE